MTELIFEPTEELLHRKYDVRSGEAIEFFVEKLVEAPTTPLPELQKHAIKEWSNELASGQCTIGEHTITVGGAHAPEHPNLTEAFKSSGYLSAKHEINIDYFMRHFSGTKAREAAKRLGFPDLEGATRSQVRQTFLSHSLDLSGSPAHGKELKQLSLAGKKFEDARMADELVRGAVPTPPERITVFSDGTNLMNKLRILHSYKSFYQTVASTLNEVPEQTPVHDAKKLYVQLYEDTVDAELAVVYPDAMALWYQAKHMHEPKKSLLTAAIEHAIPNIKDQRADFLQHKAGRLMVRLDRIRNGASRQHAGPYSAVSPELMSYLEQHETDTAETLPARLTPEEIAKLDTMTYDAEMMKQLAKSVLSDIGLLSSDTEFTSKDRPKRAADGKWQVQIREDISAMGAEDPPGVLEIPASFMRSMTKATAPVGVLPGLLHEITHLYQHDNRLNSGSGIGASVKSKNQTVYAEAGSILYETKLQADLFGRQRPVAPHYAKAMLVLESGGSEGQATKAFYESYRKANPQESAKSAATVAVSRVMRLTRRKGGFDSQPLNYAETALLLHKTAHLSDHIQGLLYEYSSFTIKDLAQLHQFDLLPTRIKRVPYEKIVDSMLTFIRANPGQKPSK